MGKPWSPRSGSGEPPVEVDRDLDIRLGSAVKRDVYKAATAGLTGITAFGALAVTGTVAGAAAHQEALEDTVRPAAPVTPQVVVKRRKHRTVVRTRIVHEASSAGVARPAAGGSVSSGGSVSTHSSSHSSGSGGSVSPSAPKPVAPAPAPAPSSGS